MKIIGFNLTKISADRMDEFKSHFSINTTIEFTEIEKTKTDIIPNTDTIKIDFKYSISYLENEKKTVKQGEILFQGFLLLATEKEETRDIIKSWKKKELTGTVKVPLFNFILRKCTGKAMSLEEDINIPHHLAIPQAELKKD
ncbi:MAG: hypothetical protein AABW65_00610 [Nanoarchaeota archaeon]